MKELPMAEAALMTRTAPSARKCAASLGPVLAEMAFPAERRRLVAHAARLDVPLAVQVLPAHAVVAELGRTAHRACARRP